MNLPIRRAAATPHAFATQAQPTTSAVPNVKTWKVGTYRRSNENPLFWQAAAVNKLFDFLPDCSGVTTIEVPRLRKLAQVIETARALSAMAGTFMTRQLQLKTSIEAGAYDHVATPTSEVIHPRDLERAMNQALREFGLTTDALVPYLRREVLETQLLAGPGNRDLAERLEQACELWSSRHTDHAFQGALRHEPLRRLESETGVAEIVVRNGKLAVDYRKVKQPQIVRVGDSLEVVRG